MAFALVSQEKRVIFRARNLKGYTQSDVRGLRLFHVLLDENDRQVLAFGTREAHHALQVFSFPATARNVDLNIISIQWLPDMNHQSHFASAIYTPSSLPNPPTQRYLLIAVMEGETVRIVRVGLSSAERLKEL
jgi:hypothetical protein